MNAGTKYWFQGQPVPDVGQTGGDSSKYWFQGQPVAIVQAAGGGGDEADDATDFRVGGAYIVERYTPTRVTDIYDVRKRTI